jgi:hypothetical protein
MIQGTCLALRPCYAAQQSCSSSFQETQKAITIAMIAAASEIPSTQRTTPVVSP